MVTRSNRWPLMIDPQVTNLHFFQILKNVFKKTLSHLWSTPVLSFAKHGLKKFGFTMSYSRRKGIYTFTYFMVTHITTTCSTWLLIHLEIANVVL